MEANLQGCFPLNCRNISAKIFILYFLMFFYFKRKVFLFFAKSYKDDIITGVDDKEINSFSDIYEVLETHKPGDKIVIKYYRMSDGSTGTAEVTLVEDK